MSLFYLFSGYVPLYVPKRLFSHRSYCNIMSLRIGGIFMEFENYIKPELLIIVPVIYIIGMMIKKTEKIDDKWIPLILGIFGVIISCLYVMSVEGVSLTGIFTGITQGVLTSGCAVFVNQLVKQTGE